MKKIGLFLSTLLFSVSVSFPAFSGEWVRSELASDMWNYKKDDGSFANEEWIKDGDNWYWIEKGLTKGFLPLTPGISKDGYLYNSKGMYVDMKVDGRHFITPELCDNVHLNMSYEQVYSILGKEHEVYKSDSYPESNKQLDVYPVLYYSSDANSTVSIIYLDGHVYSKTPLWK